MIGELLYNRYKILQKLGQGGFGQTYLAEDINLNKIRVVKKLQPQSTDPDVLAVARRLFETESDVLNMLGENHPQIPQLFDRFEENQEFYLVQEYIEGETLLVELSRGSMSEAQVKQLLIDILQPLSFVHQQNIIHRDIKPDNLIRRKCDNQICLIDFGAVKQIFTATANPQNKNSPTVAIGHPLYIPEEQEKGHPTLASDIYALGISAVQALTGAIPTQRDPKTLQVIWQKPASVSDEFAAILNKTIAREADDRYQNASEVLAALTPTQVSLKPVPANGKLAKKTYLAVLIPASLLAFGLGIGAFLLRDRLFAPEPAPPTPPINQPGPL